MDKVGDRGIHVTPSGVSPFLSVCMPTYNRSVILLQQLRNLATYQTGEIEVCISDNASTDDTWSILQRYEMERRDLLTIHRNDRNIGAGANFLKCLEMAKGQYCWLVGDDTHVKWHLLPELIRYLKTDGSEIVFFCNRDNVTWLGGHDHVNSLQSLYDNGTITGDLHFLGNYVFKREASIQHLPSAYKTTQWEHPYVYVAYALIKEGARMALCDLLPFENTTMPLELCDYRVLPRWNVARSHVGAWKTSREVALNEHDLLKQIDMAEARFRLKTIAAAVVRDLAGIAPSGISTEWSFVLARAPGKQFLLWAALRALWLLRRWPTLMTTTILTTYFAADKNARRILVLYLPEINTVGLWSALYQSIKSRRFDRRFTQTKAY